MILITKLAAHMLGSVKDPAKLETTRLQLSSKELDDLKKKYPNKAILAQIDDGLEIWHTPMKHTHIPWWKK